MINKSITWHHLFVESRSLVMLFNNLAKVSLNLTSKRFVRKKVILKSWPNDWVPFHWKRPEKVPGYLNAGDLVDLPQPSQEDIQVNVRNSQEIAKLSVDDPKRKIFSLDHARRSHHNKALVDHHMRRLGLIHEVEYNNSLEAQIINNTFALRHAYEMIKTSGGTDGRFNAHHRQFANDVKYRRYRLLCDLKELHMDRWQRLIKELDIEPPENKINVKFVRPFRKKQMRLLAESYARDMKEKKVEEYMKALEKEKVEFEEEKKETLKWIEEKEKQLGITV